jgi:hypothetical protein
MSSFVDSKHQKLSKDEIVAIAAKETGGKYTPEQIKASLMSEVQDLGGIMMEEGNTLFIIHKAPERPDIGVFRAINADIIPNYLKNSMNAAKAFGLMGFQYLVTVFDDPSIINIFKYIGRNQPFPNMGFQVAKLKDGRYKVTINMGDIKKGGLPDISQPATEGVL